MLTDKLPAFLAVACSDLVGILFIRRKSEVRR
jgi:hypothetical protein